MSLTVVFRIKALINNTELAKQTKTELHLLLRQLTKQ